jgi:hypothetical protein
VETKPIIIPAGFKSDAVDLGGDLSREAPRKVRGSNETKPKPKGTVKDPKPKFGQKQK